MIELLKKNKAYLLIGYALLLIIHFVVKDKFYFTGIIFYSFPLLILILLLLLITPLFYSNKKYFIFLIFSGLVFSIYWYKNYHVSHVNQNIKGKVSSILFWNIATQEDYNIKILSNIIADENIETIILVEAYHKKNSFNKDFQTLIEDYNILFLKHDMIVLSRKKIELVNEIYEQESFKLNHLKIGEEYPKTIVIVDIRSTPFYNRENALGQIINYSKKYKADIILGDFNTPHRSVYFKAYRDNYQSFRDYQNGFTATWPYGIPLLEIDHIWINNSYKPLSLEKQNYARSDHSLLIGKFQKN
ncbi:endonuclease/exonuclease/phosphatase family protein [Winogradskyella sp. PG-2]|uniref:endonuclease/exonuclease/phosphatase family protein n=1 Tax=Winogradskyella sp. PG-2 TaxID=754409 RepID=UPI0004585D30|nr:endonuclease/exonuclease/phosphatase family protein [Winogradskyella sp. PG-2]BAO74880.1 hypothetical protein WPG_0650 [Winogradskyella sp. PG-2]